MLAIFGRHCGLRGGFVGFGGFREASGRLQRGFREASGASGRLCGLQRGFVGFRGFREASEASGRLHELWGGFGEASGHYRVLRKAMRRSKEVL